MTSRSLLAVTLVAVLLPAAAAAKLTKKSVAKIWPSQVGFALDAAGVPHLAYSSPDHLPFHAVQVSKKFESTLVDARPDAGWDAAVGVDAMGGVHVAYHAERLPAHEQLLVYAYSDGGPWQVEDVAPGGYGTSLAVDGDDRAHLLYSDGSGNLSYAEQEDNGFEIHPLGFQANAFRPTSLALDADGHAHACWVNNTGLGVDAFYGTNAAGDWEQTLLDANGHLCSLALAADGTPIVATLGPEALRLFRQGGMGFDEEVIIDFDDALPGIGIGPDGVAVAVGEGGRAFLVATIYASQGGGGSELQLFFADDGEEWLFAVVGTKDEGFDPRLAIGPDGRLQGIWRSGGDDSAKLSYLTATFPDLAGSWGGVAASGGLLSGTLTVENEGSEKSKSAPIALYLSSDAVLDGGDTLLPGKFKAGGVAAGDLHEVAIEVEVMGSVSGLYLIAVLDPDKDLEDLDRSDNTVAALIP
jgi:hypothetical protein